MPEHANEKMAFKPLLSEDMALPSGGWPLPAESGAPSSSGIMASGEANYFWFAQIIPESGGHPELNKFYPHPTGKYFGITKGPYDEYHGVEVGSLLPSSVFYTLPRNQDKIDVIKASTTIGRGLAKRRSITDSMAAPDDLVSGFSNGPKSLEDIKAKGAYDFEIFNPYIHYYHDSTIAAGSVVIYTPAGPVYPDESKPYKVAYNVYEKVSEPYERYGDKSFTTSRDPFDASIADLKKAKEDNAIAGVPNDSGTLPLHPRPVSKWHGTSEWPVGAGVDKNGVSTGARATVITQDWDDWHDPDLRTVGNGNMFLDDQRSFALDFENHEDSNFEVKYQPVSTLKQRFDVVGSLATPHGDGWRLKITLKAASSLEGTTTSSQVDVKYKFDDNEWKHKTVAITVLSNDPTSGGGVTT